VTAVGVVTTAAAAAAEDEDEEEAVSDPEGELEVPVAIMMVGGSEVDEAEGA